VLGTLADAAHGYLDALGRYDSGGVVRSARLAGHLALLAYDRQSPISHVAAALALAALVLVLLRFALTLLENARLLEHSRREANTDGLTGLPNRRRLMRDLEEAMAQPGTLLALYDLDGFKGYNDALGHAEGDLLLARLGGRLAAAVAGHGPRSG